MQKRFGAQTWAMQFNDHADPADEPRRLSLWLILGVYALPLIFAWFTLRRGYSAMVREGAFLLAGFSVVVGAARLLTF